MDAPRKMTTVNDQGSIVWSKGDNCMSPYSGDHDLYKGVIRKMRRSPAGQVLALVKFDDYGEDDSEEVNIENLQKVKEKVKASSLKRKAVNSPAPGGMFSPLQGSEFSQRLKVKYESDSENDEELSTRREKLTSVVFGKKTSTSGSQASRSENKSRKRAVAIGGEPIKGSSSAKTGPDKRKSFEPESPSPTSSRRKGQLDVSGGQARDFQKELITSKRLSDISSIVDSRVVKKALQRQAECTGYSSDDDVTSGFSEEDLEKPKFTFKPEGAKVPLVLSGAEDSAPVQVPGTLNQYLRDYQRDGIKFLYSHYTKNRGAILGDDMGLGKTVQVIGFLSALLGKQGNRVDVMRQKPKFIRQLSHSASIRNDAPSKGPFLIIGPGCVLYNWLEELDTWGYFTVRKYHGLDKTECLKEIKKGKVEIVVTTFETFREHLGNLNSIDWEAVIVDEVHKIKDMKARTTKALRNIVTSRRYGLTGTALQNNLLEFWSILDWAQPGCLGSQGDFVHEFVHPIESGQRHDANKRELATARKRKDKLAMIRKSMMIRRLKSLIADQLPKKDDSVVFCKLSQLQVSIYQTILDHPGMDLVIHGEDPCSCDSGEPQSKCCKKESIDGASVKSLMFTFMHLLLKTSNHVALLIPTQKTSEKQAKTARKICEAALKQHPEFVVQTKEASFKTLSDPKYCGKMKILQGLLKVFYKEHSKALVFSYSTQVLDIIEQHLMSTGYEYRRIDGSVSPKKRMLVVREFNTDPNIFICIISTKAGGLGLNLTGANKVVIFDPNWNPAHDLQAQDRAYRIGQRRNVQVYRLVSSGTIEENMYLRQIYKQQLLNVTVEDENAKRYFYAVQGNPKQKGELFGVKNMFVLRTGGSCITRDIIKRNERVESALAGLETAQYIPPVVRVDDDEEYEDIVGEANSSADSTENSVESESEDLFAQFFTPDESDDRKDESLEADKNSSDSEDGNTFHDVKSSMKGDNSYKSDEKNPENCINDSASDDDIDINTAIRKTASSKKNQRSKSKHRQQVTFQEPTKGKVKPTESRKGKCPMKRSNVDDDNDKDSGVQYDQTLAGTFADVSDVFDNCGVVHIHKNVKVVGGSRAEDHMSKCAIADVYELHQNSQDLAAQCEPMSEPSDEEFPEPVRKDGGRVLPVEDHNTERSTVIGSTKFLIGQTPKAFRLAYRIGQRRNVQVYRLVSSGTIEENMYLRQIYKQQLLNVTVEDENAKRYFYAVQGNPKQKGELFGVKNMFVLRTGGSCITRDIIKRNERVESALAGLETAQYIPPVVRVDDDEEYEDIVGEANSSADSTENSVESESEDLFAQFFTPDESDDRKDESLEADKNSSDSEDGNTFHDVKSSMKGDNSYKSDEKNPENCINDSASDDDIDINTAIRKTASSKKNQRSKSKHRQQVTFQEPTKGKVKPTESRKGKCPMKRSNVDDDNDKDSGVQYDQTLAGTFADVSDVFDNCGVVHIHKNVKVVGGSRAEDHMSKCAIADVYELHQNSQDLAAQCEPMSEPSDEEFPEPVRKDGGRVLPVEDHNTERSTVIGSTKFLIGQTPKAFRLKHLEEMSQHHKAGSLLEFAELVLSSGISERISLLNNFYETKTPALKDVHKLKYSISDSRHAEQSYSKRKYEREKLKYARKRNTASRLRSSIGQSIAFLDNVEPDSESVSQHSIRSDTPRSDVDSMEVGRNISHRKRDVSSPKKRLIKKCKVEGRIKHEPVASTYFENDYVEEENGRNIDTERETKCEDAEDLLDEIGKHSEENDTKLLAGARIGHKIQEQKRNKTSTVSNILDDMFFDVGKTVKQIKKTPPSKNSTKSSPVKKVTRNEREKNVSQDDDPFKAVDEIFGSNYSRRDLFKAGNKKISVSDKTKHSRKSIDVLFDDSTLKDDNYDCFDDPKLWKKKKRKEADKRNLVDRLIEDSDADFNDLFTSGKLKKNIPVAKQDELNNKQNSESRGLLDGSASLFS